jgi:CheY-like chemotaxis protein
MTFLAPAPTPDSGEAPIKVLVVDDSNELVALIAAWLEDEGCIVFTALSGNQAIDIVKSHDPEVVLLDLVIPPPDGFQVCESLLQRENPPEIIMMTGMSEPSRLRRVEELGGIVLLRKPFTGAVIVDAVRRVAAHRRYERVRP